MKKDTSSNSIELSCKKSVNTNGKNTGKKEIEFQNTLTRSHIRDAFHRHLNLTAEESSRVLESIVEAVKEGLLQEDYLKIFSFGTFLVHKKKARVGRNPKTKKEVTIAPRKSISFRPSAKLVDLINTPPK